MFGLFVSFNPSPYLTCRKLVVQGFGVRSVREDIRHGEFFLNSQQLQAQEVSVYCLATDRLRGRRDSIC